LARDDERDWPHDLAGELRRTEEHLSHTLRDSGAPSWMVHPHHHRPPRGGAPYRTTTRVVTGGGVGLIGPFVFLMFVAMFIGTPGLFLFASPVLLVFLFLALAGRMFRWQSGHRREYRVERPPPTVADRDEARLRATCERLLEELETAPESVRRFLTRPRETIETLRDTGVDLLRRERELRALVDERDAARLDSERRGLLARIEQESDFVTRGRLEAALAALDQQREQRAAILRSANRLEAEQTRLTYTLEGLLTQVLRVKNAGGHEPGAPQALRQSIVSLRDEIGALADALEEVEVAPTMPRVRPESEGPFAPH
jgi:hypothetical protein